MNNIRCHLSCLPHTQQQLIPRSGRCCVFGSRSFVRAPFFYFVPLHFTSFSKVALSAFSHIFIGLVPVVAAASVVFFISLRFALLFFIGLPRVFIARVPFSLSVVGRGNFTQGSGSGSAPAKFLPPCARQP